MVALNEGNGQFTLVRLPKEVQLSSVHAICITDLNNDNKPDLLMGGNQYAMMPQFGRLDASFGHVLLNNGAGNFEWIEPKQSGLQVKGAIKDIQQVQGKNNGYLLLRNNDTPVFVKFAREKIIAKTSKQ
jgi:enediyne biosynthesis protein E4